MKRLDESVPRQLGEILIKHGQATLTDPKLCENLLKDYFAAYKEEISLLVLAVRERVASDLLVSQAGFDRDLLRSLLIKRLRKGHSLEIRCGLIDRMGLIVVDSFSQTKRR